MTEGGSRLSGPEYHRISKIAVITKSQKLERFIPRPSKRQEIMHEDEISISPQSQDNPDAFWDCEQTEIEVLWGCTPQQTRASGNAWAPPPRSWPILEPDDFILIEIPNMLGFRKPNSVVWTSASHRWFPAIVGGSALRAGWPIEIRHVRREFLFVRYWVWETCVGIMWMNQHGRDNGQIRIVLSIDGTSRTTSNFESE